MIPVCFPHEMTLGYDDGTQRRFLASAFASQEPGGSFDPARVYLALEETLIEMHRGCLSAGLPPPLKLSADILGALPKRPLPLAVFLEQARTAPPAKASICLINGGGGGLGDGIMFAPALDILLSRLRGLGIGDIDLAVYSVLPLRTASILGRIPGVRVLSLPVSLTDFMAHDAYVDFTGMLNDPRFATLHMTDFVLERLGIDPTTVADREKEPFLNLGGPALPEVKAALALARAAAHGKPLLAVVFISAYTRTMPDGQAASLIKRLSASYYPLLFFPAGWQSAAFVERNGLKCLAHDMSAASPTFNHYFALLSGVDAILTVDTSAVHLGAAFRKPTVAIFNSINQETRIRYSPTVHGVQLVYQGKQCQAPCGLSKSRAYVEGKMPGGQPFRLECGYACDEAVDREEILQEAIDAVKTIDPNGNTSTQLETIRQAMADRLHAALAPCWETIDESMIETALALTMARVEQECRQTCPVCLADEVHDRIGRYWGVDRFQCATCKAIFDDDGAPTPPYPGSAGQDLPLSTADLHYASSILRPLLPPLAKVLGVSGRGEARSAEPWQDFLAKTSSGPFVPSLWDRRRQATAPDAGLLGLYDAVIPFCLINCEPRPADFMRILLSHLKPGGILVLLAQNSQNLGQGVMKSRGAANADYGVGWQQQTFERLLDGHGLQKIWLGTTPVHWRTIEQAAGEIPALRIQPPGQDNVVVRLEGRELAVPVKQYLAQVLQNISGHGQFWLCCARKPI